MAEGEAFPTATGGEGDLLEFDPDGEVGGVPPSPVDMAMSVQPMPGPNGETIVLLGIQTPLGLSTYWLAPATAADLGRQLIQASKAQFQPRLVVPDSRLMVPGR